jgi:hypothetical protein
MRCFLCSQYLQEGFDARLGQGGGQAGIGKDLRELGEEHHDQGPDLILRLLLPHRLSLRVQTDQLPRLWRLVRW